MKKIKSCVLIESRKKNKYFYDKKKKKIIICPPVFYFLLKLLDEGRNIREWLAQLQEELLKIDGYGFFSRKEIEYYYKKYLLLKENGYFGTIDQEEQLKGRLTADDVKESLANARQITFEVTDQCQLYCEYCGYGKFYSNYDKRKNKCMDTTAAKLLLNYLQQLWNSSLNHSHDRNIYVSFYGGEPLLNVAFIKRMIAYVKELKLIHNRITFAMTTNGLLLEKYMDFLVANDFSLLISLDGNEANNSYRVFKNGGAAFQEILKNVKSLQAKYPEYLKKRVNFNAVLHNKNSVSEIFNFFKLYFDKIPRISALNTSGINEDQKEAFWKTYSNINENLYKSEDYSLIEKEMFIKLPNVQSVSTFLHNSNDFSFDNYNDLLYPIDKQVRLPTGTCLPFSKKIFVTVNGKILACERIGQQYVLGHVNNKVVTIDFKEIASKYNAYYNKLKKQCSVCYNVDQCTQCIFNLNLLSKRPECKGFMTRQEYSRHLASYLDFIENKPAIYSKIINEVLVI